MTNLFVNDQRYWHVALLWRQWAELHAVRLTPEELAKRYDQYCTSFDAFCRLLVARSLDGLGFVNETDQTLWAGGRTVELVGPLGAVEVQVDANGLIQLSVNRSAQLRIVPVPDRFIRGGIEATSALVNSLRSTRTTIHTIVLYPGDSDDRNGLDLQLAASLNTIGNDDRVGNVGSPGLLPVTPLELDSAERVIRSIRWALAIRIVSGYPPRARIERDATSVVRAFSWCSVQGDEVVIRRPPRDDELAEANRAIASLVRRDSATAVARRAGARSFSKTSASLMSAIAELDPIKTCPVCLQPVPPSSSIAARDDDTFWVTCPACSAEWGSQRCGVCARPFPVMRRHFSADVAIDAVDHEFGGDVLAVPCWRRVRENTYICPHCGECGEASQAVRHGDCRRCVSSDLPKSAVVQVFSSVSKPSTP
jgi:hypothetical protein